MSSQEAGLDVWVRAQVGSATRALREEHELILRALRLLERAGRRLAVGQRVDARVFKALVGLLRTLADECHHAKEEGYLFPAMVAKGVLSSGPVGTILAEHNEERDYLAVLSGQRSRAERAAAALLCVRVMRWHIEKENEVLFPLADELFTTDEQVTLARSYDEMEAAAFGAGFRGRTTAELARLEGAIPVAKGGSQ